MIAKRYIVRGRVQGVGFRWFVDHEARSLGLAGWVRNNIDGTVEALAMGSDQQHAVFAGKLRRGPRAARVDEVTELPAEPVDGLTTFRILFYDITTLLKDKVGFATLIDSLSEHYLDRTIDLVLGIEARGFIFGPALAYRLNAGFVPIRKPRKLPAETVKWTYDLEYGTDTLEIHKDAIQRGQRIIIVDDLLATGGTANACLQLAQSLGAKVEGMGFVVELDFLGGRKKFDGTEVFSLLHYDK
jgi:adenine phosphoribosyltransferase